MITNLNPFDRSSNLKIINDIRNSEKIALDAYINNVLIPLRQENSSFCETLYKDIAYILDDIDNPGDNDLIIKNGDLVIEDGDFKLTGYQTRLHDVCNWLHMQVVEKTLVTSKHPTDFMDKMQGFNDRFLTNFNFTPEYHEELDKIKRSIKKERKYNYENRKPGWRKFLDIDVLELKPNFMGLGININEILRKIFKK